MVAIDVSIPSARYTNVCSLMVRTASEVELVVSLLACGLSDYEIARRSGVSCSTIQRWRRSGLVRRPDFGADWRVSDPLAYCYLLGCYLGDGHIAHRPPNGWTLRVSCDRLYPGIIDEVMLTMAETFSPRQPTGFASSSCSAEVVTISHPGIGRAFPQHGPGPKHRRAIALTDWQRELTRAHPKALIRGLIHSDGCRTVNSFCTGLPSGRVGEYAYVRYFFSNLSSEIREIFREHCELLGIRVTQPNHRNLAVSHRVSVAILDSFIGPKT
jgi:hypothetical protein